MKREPVQFFWKEYILFQNEHGHFAVGDSSRIQQSSSFEDN